MALDEFSGDKALGQDGFSMAFLRAFGTLLKQRCWSFSRSSLFMVDL